MTRSVDPLAVLGRKKRVTDAGHGMRVPANQLAVPYAPAPAQAVRTNAPKSAFGPCAAETTSTGRNDAERFDYGIRADDKAEAFFYVPDRGLGAEGG
jgi:hypothetical protein